MLNLAIDGTGNWPRRMVNAVQGVSDKVRFTAAASRTPETKGAFAAEFGLKVQPLDAVLSDPAVDALVIASAHSAHRPHANAAAAAGKHLFVEKPLAPALVDARAIVRAAEDASVCLAHGFNRRFAPAFREMQRRVETGEIGEILHLEGQFSGPSGFGINPGAWRGDRAECPAGAMTARGIHALDSMIALAGPVARLHGFSDRRVIEAEVDDVTSAHLRFASGATGFLASHHATAEIWRVQVYGSGGWIEMRGDAELVVRSVGDAEEKVSLTPVDKERLELEAFADMISGQAIYPVTQQDALNGIAVLEALVASAASGEAVDVAT
ncbi:Gfo/Idh/MocA family protein [Pseudoruegeria sp. HB172150]|uniref:Gfo/Idh/MocA family protein n=1 Tax=Pseudoruegeria sp. HB172150 TaxID=2721164 RepID=UPI00155367DF|nr:Gfo/Idh/MocA family oxidoreductase [Pseudoruegeria sp. HB172150]